MSVSATEHRGSGARRSRGASYPCARGVRAVAGLYRDLGGQEAEFAPEPPGSAFAVAVRQVARGFRGVEEYENLTERA